MALRLEGTVTADSLMLGAFTLSNVTAALKVLPAGADVSSFEGGVLWAGRCTER